MIVYRFTPEKYCEELNGEGAAKFGGRWNSKGRPVTYTSFSISLSLVELLVHSAGYNEILANRLTLIEVPDKHSTEILSGRLKPNWQLDESYSKYIGDEFLSSGSHLLLKVPSAIIPEESNILINPRHKDFSKVKISAIKKFHFDTRLFKN